MDPVIIAVFIFVYAGMMLGEIPGLALDRTGVALVGAIMLLASGRISPDGAMAAVDLPTIALLFGLMVVSAQFRLGGFYAAVTQRLALASVSPSTLLALVIGVSGVLSALLANDIVCLAMAPVLAEGCARRRLNPVPFLLALACASNVGSAATLIGNPQNMLIGQSLRLSFGGYMLDALAPSIMGLAAVWAVIRWRVGTGWETDVEVRHVESPRLDLWQTTKALVVLSGLVASFLFFDWPREVLALAAAGVLLASRRMSSRTMLSLVDWHLLVLFIALFVVNACLESTGALAFGMEKARAAGVDVTEPAWLFGITAVLSNVVSNVPAVMLLLPAATHPLAGPILALSSTLAGNLLIVGSIANIIVVDQAAQSGIRIGWRDHASVGIPVTLVTLGMAAGWLMLRA